MASILVCTNDGYSTRFLTNQLRSRDHEVSIAISVGDSEDQIADSGFNLIIAFIPAAAGNNGSDEVDGVEVCRYVKADERLKHIPVLLLSIPKAEKLKKQGTDAGADAVLQSPFSPEDLHRVVRDLLQGDTSR